ncbi:MAG: lipoyl(octanoyl) transferase LipB [Brumimicrobium sp.]
MVTNVIFKDLGLVDYKDAWNYQEELFKKNVDTKIALRKNETTEPTKNYLLFCEHPHVYTLGKSGDLHNLLLSPEKLEEIDATYYKTNRGGDITYHGPGQIVGYPIFDLDTYFFSDIHKYMRYLEEAVILTIADYGIKGSRVEGKTGVWIGKNSENERKICAMGVRASRWVTMHGMGFNVNTDLSYFNHIVPCGIEDKGVTSIKNELGYSVDMDEVKGKLKKNIAQVFDLTYI